MQNLKRVAVFCGAGTGNDSSHAVHAKAFANTLAQKQLSLVYGGAKIGIMGILADTMLMQSAEVIGVMPKFIAEKEIAHTNITHLHIVESMHDRKALIYQLADGFVLLPGGIGSLDEFFEILTWAQLGLHKKPCGILNINNYYSTLIQFLDQATQSGFISSSMREMIIIEGSAQALLNRFENYEAPSITRHLKSTEQT